jgi:hypothetical protein
MASSELSGIELFSVLFVAPAYGVYILRSVAVNRIYYLGIVKINSERSAPFGALNYLAIMLALLLLFLPLGLVF